uniref:Uncharacterized protein n=1 Tax=Pararge aegeria TaxID=116150 RepID=S4NMU2_9NEOP
MIKAEIIRDDNLRQKRTKINFSDIITTNHVQSLSMKDLKICLKNYNINDIKMEEDNSPTEILDDRQDIKPEKSKYDVVASLPQTAEIKAKEGASTWIEISSESDVDSS